MRAPSCPPLLLVPTPLEQRALAELGGWNGLPALELCGFGPVSAAARTAQLLAERRPRRVALVGLAGALREQPLGSALEFACVCLDGIGAGVGEAFAPASRLGFPQWEDGAAGRVEETLELALEPAPGLAREPGELLTVCAASADASEARFRRARYPAALAEDMEAFGVALACRLFGTELLVVRGLSNRAGERDPARWRVREALAAARTLLLARITAERA